MNIFILDNNIKKCAKYHCNKHVCKMIIESCQMLANAFTLKELEHAPKTKAGQARRHSYTHHPCSKWVLKSHSDFKWLLTLTNYLLQEYIYRYNKIHFCLEFVEWVIKNQKIVYNRLPEEGLLPFVLAMPEIYKSENAVESYRAYYMGEKKSFVKWTKRKIPKWYKGGIKNECNFT